MGVERIRRDSGVLHGSPERGTLRVDAERVWIEREGASSVRSFARSSIVRGWFVPAFAERALGLALAGGPRELVTTASFVPWLVLESRDGHRVSVATPDRAASYALLDALSVGPSTADLTIELYTPPRSSEGEAPRWLSTREAYARTGGAAAGSLLLAGAGSFAAHSITGSLAVLVASTLAGVVAARHRRRSATRLRVDRQAGRIVMERLGEREVQLSVRGIESVRLLRTGFVLEHCDAPRPIAVTILSPVESSRAVEGAMAPLAKLRLAHAVVDWAQRLGEASVGP